MRRHSSDGVPNRRSRRRDAVASALTFGEQMRMKKRSGQTIFELLVFIGLFALVFFPAHLVANRAGNFAGFSLGFLIAMIIASLWLRLGKRGGDDTKPTGDMKAPNKASDVTSEPAPGAASSSREG